MGRSLEVVMRENSKPPHLIDIPWVRIDLREIAHEPVVLENGVDEKSIGVTYDPQLAPDDRSHAINEEVDRKRNQSDDQRQL